MKNEYKKFKVTRAFVYDKEDDSFKGNLDKMFAIIDKDTLEGAVGDQPELMRAIEFIGTVVEAKVEERPTSKDPNKMWVKVTEIKSITIIKRSSSSMSEDPILRRVRENIKNGKKSNLGYYSIEKVMNRLRENNKGYKENGFPEYYQTPNTLKSFIQDLTKVKVNDVMLGEIIFGKDIITNEILLELKGIYDEFVKISSVPISAENKEEVVKVEYDNLVFDDPFAKNESKPEIKVENEIKPTEVVVESTPEDDVWASVEL